MENRFFISVLLFRGRLPSKTVYRRGELCISFKEAYQEGRRDEESEVTWPMKDLAKLNSLKSFFFPVKLMFSKLWFTKHWQRSLLTSFLYRNIVWLFVYWFGPCLLRLWCHWLLTSDGGKRLLVWKSGDDHSVWDFWAEFWIANESHLLDGDNPSECLLLLQHERKRDEGWLTEKYLVEDTMHT